MWLGALWAALSWLLARRRTRLEARDGLRGDFRTQTRGGGFRVTEWLRDRLRPGWLRMRRDD